MLLSSQKCYWTEKIHTHPMENHKKKPVGGVQGCLSLAWKTRKFQLENQMVRIIPFGVLLKLWASGQSDAFLLLLLGFTADVHTFCMLSIFCEDKLNHFVFMPKISIWVVCVNQESTPHFFWNCTLRLKFLHN